MPDTAAFLALKTAENEESCPQDIDWKELISDILTEVMLKMANGQYPPIVSKETTNRNMNTLINEMTSYLMQCYARSHQEEKDQKVCLFLLHLYIYTLLKLRGLCLIKLPSVATFNFMCYPNRNQGI